MSKTVTVSAPGKLMLFGEHAVVYGKPCIVTAMNQRLFVTVEKITKNEFQLDAPDLQIKQYKKEIDQLGKGNIPKGAAFVEIACANFFKKYSMTSGIRVATTSEFSHTYGFGSSSAATVCTMKALAETFAVKLSQKELFELSYKTVFDIQKTGSGVDVAAAVYGGTLYFIIGGKIIHSLSIESLPLIVGYSGVKADTTTLLNQVKETAKKYPDIMSDIYTAIEIVVNHAKKALIANDLQTVGDLMNINQGLLESLGIGTNQLSNMIYAARDNGAYGAKLSGAGGGDCMIAVSPKNSEEKVKQGIQRTGGQILVVQANAKGVKVES